MKKPLLFFALFVIISTLNAQHAYKNIIPVPTQDEVGFDLLESSDKSILVAGYYTTISNNEWKSGIMKIDSFGSLQSLYPFGSNSENEGFHFKKTSDGGYILIGINAVGLYIYRMLVIKVDAQMAFQWEKELPITPYGIDWTQTPEPMYDIIQSRDGNFIAAGFDNISLSLKSAYLAKLNALTGDTMWTKRYSHADHTYQFNSLVMSPDSGYIAVGNANARSNQNNNILLFKFDEDGNKIWEQIIGGVIINQRGNKLTVTSNYYIVAGKRLGGAWEALLLKTDLSGNVLTSKTYQETSYPGWDDIFGLDKTIDGGYVISGYTNNATPVGYIVKADSNLNKIWSRTFPNSSKTVLYSVISTSDGGYAAAGFTTVSTRWDLLIIKTDAVGNESCDNFPVPAATTPDAVDPGTVCQFTSLVNFGTGNFTYKWSGAGGFSSTLANPSHTYMNGGNYPYTLEVTDQNGCKGLFAGKVIVTSCDAPVITASVTNASCGLNNGTIFMNISGGISPYTYSWSNNSTNKDQIDLGAGTFTVTVTGGDGCPAIKSVSVSKTQNPTISLKTLTNPSSDTTSDGSIDITVAGGVQPYTYTWSNAQNIQDISGLSIGTYTVTVTDSKGCTKTAEYTLTGPCGAFSVSGMITNPTSIGASDGSINASITGGTSPYQYNWSNGQITQDPINLSAGNYSVSVTDNNNCTSVASFTLVDPVSINETEKNEMLKTKLYPNPFIFSTKLFINSNIIPADNFSIEFFSLTGKKLYTLSYEKSNSFIVINFPESLPSGTYLYKINAKNCNSQLGKFVKF